MPPDEPTDEEKQQQLPQDNGTPFQPAEPSSDQTGSATDPSPTTPPPAPDDTHPATDSGIEPEETYNQGPPGPTPPQGGDAGTGESPDVGQAGSDPGVPPGA